VPNDIQRNVAITFAGWFGVGAMLTFATNAQAQSTAANYPNRQIRLIVPFAPGGPNDFLARAIGQRLTERWGQPAIIDNRPGASGNIGAELTAKSAPDGYTLLLATQGILAVNPSLTKLRVDTLKDLAPIALVASLTSVMVVHPSLQVKTVKELIALAKARPGELTYGTPGNGSASHLAMEIFNRAAHVNIRHIPYKGAAPAVVDLIGGTLQVMLIGVPVVMPHVLSGRLVALGVASAGPSPMAPGLITIAQSGGLPGFEIRNWLGLVAAAGTPRDIVEKLNTGINEILRVPDVKEQLLKNGFEPTGSTPEYFATYLESELKVWARVVKDAGITVD
jgi:tripartite-type tricarboxylate transporter receptor subunit TctC